MSVMSIVSVGLVATLALEFQLLINSQRHTGSFLRFERLVTCWNWAGLSLMIFNTWPAEELFTALVEDSIERDVATVVAEYHGVSDLHD